MKNIYTGQADAPPLHCKNFQLEGKDTEITNRDFIIQKNASTADATFTENLLLFSGTATPYDAVGSSGIAVMPWQKGSVEQPRGTCMAPYANTHSQSAGATL